MNTNYEISEVLFDYLLVVNPDVVVTKDVARIRQYIAATLNDGVAVAAPVHVALFRSEFPERFEEDFIAMIEEVAKRQSGFAIYTSRLEAARNADGRHSILINVANPKPLTELHKSVMQAFELKPQTYFKPHMVVSRGLEDAAIEKILPALTKQLFVRSFNCHCFTLLKRPAGGGKYEKVRDIVFGDIEHLTGSLFNYAA
ncbi:2'-5' RNA ligase family protein [Chitinophaga solisilvae]|uniref:2'-5' RNA ligase family protein n=1 Tax=Chitinophaga solisilvae TaxID=1233460 RepID=A0A3S1B461_9BACT|nr:2'-5' RNA ligase family protein [Chitinophaga solisilvae]NSL91120.1 2'-5' RNA ligase family protein [Chitinophaga solisilvae]